MLLTSFRVWNYRSINDSGPVTAERITALLGRNESGKTNLLRALQSLNPSTGFSALSPIKDFPRHRRLSECTPTTKVLETTWDLTTAERTELTKISERAAGAKTITIGRYYDGPRYAGFQELPSIPFSDSKVATQVRDVGAQLNILAAGISEDKRAVFDTASKAFLTGASVKSDANAWAKGAVTAISALKNALTTASARLPDKENETLIELDGLANRIMADAGSMQKARDWVVARLPIFIFLDEYPELVGHQNIAEYIARKAQTREQNRFFDADRNFEKLCKVAGISPEELQALRDKNDPETRNQLANRAGSVVTREIKRLWKDRPLKVRFNLDAEHFDTLISDPNATYDVEVNLDDRSRGFKWFFSFYITFAADTHGGDAEKAILLLDEPGLYLHALSQEDLLRHFESDFKNQIAYTTHSPFMVPTKSLERVRTVNIDESAGTTVTNNPTGDSRTLFPLQSALGYTAAQSLFVGPQSVVVEGVTDFWITSAVSEYLRDLGKMGLADGLITTPAGGAQKTSYMVALLASQRLDVVLLLDDEKNTKETKTELVKSKLIREENVVFVSEAFATNTPSEADIEDLFDPRDFEALVRESYAKELEGKTLTLNAKIPRIVKRVEIALAELGIEFHKTRPARLFLSKMATSPISYMKPDVIERFERLFGIINKRMSKHAENDRKPFQ